MSTRLLATTALVLSLAAPALAQTSTSTTTNTTGTAATQQQGTTQDTGTSNTAGSSQATQSTGGSSSTTGTATTNTGSSGTAAATTAPAPEGAIITQQSEDQFRADKVIGAKVTNAQKENVGSVKDMLLDKDGKVVGVILSVGGFLGIGDKSVAVNWSDIKIEKNGSMVMVDMTKDQIKAAPKFVAREEVAETPAQPSGTATQPLTAPATGSTQSGSTTTQ